jgi:hypothetical protein
MWESIWIGAVCIYPDRHRTKHCRNLTFEPLFCEVVGFVYLACSVAYIGLFRLLRARLGSSRVRSVCGPEPLCT